MTSMVRCELGARTFAVPLEQVFGIRRLDEVSDRPVSGPQGSIGWIAGPAGAEVPVVPLGVRLGTADPVRRDGKLLVLSAGAFVVDRVLPLVDVPESRVFPLPPALARSFAGTTFSAVILMPDEEPSLQLSPEGLGGAPTFAPAPRPAAASGSSPAGPVGRGRILLLRGAGAHTGAPLFAISATQVLEVLALPAPMPVPGAAASVLGLGVWREQPIPVIDLSRAFGLERDAIALGASRWLVARGASGTTVGLAVSQTIDVLSLPLEGDARPVTPPASLIDGIALGAFQTAWGLVLVPDLDAL